MLSSIFYGCEAWGDISCVEAKLVSIELQLLQRILNVKNGTSTDIIYYELKRPVITSKISNTPFRKCNYTFTNLCWYSYIIDYYFNLTGNYCVECLSNLGEKIQTDNHSMVLYYGNMIEQEKPCIYQVFLSDYYRKIITRWRISSHKLKIETGRYARPYIKREDRFFYIMSNVGERRTRDFQMPIVQFVTIELSIFVIFQQLS